MLTNVSDENTLRARIDALRKRRVYGESLTVPMLLVVLEALESRESGGFDESSGWVDESILAIKEEISACEDWRAIAKRKRAYNAQLLLGKIAMPLPAQALVASYLMTAPLAATRRVPTKFTFTAVYLDAMGEAWTWAPYSGEAWRGSFRSD